MAETMTLPLQIGPDALGPDAFVHVPAAEFTVANGIPEAVFHVCMTYAILRSRGVDVGKKDILIPFLPEGILEKVAGTVE
jgi:hypothetical protein